MSIEKFETCKMIIGNTRRRWHFRIIIDDLLFGGKKLCKINDDDFYPHNKLINMTVMLCNTIKGATNTSLSEFRLNQQFVWWFYKH
jgi:hypothetical protein